MSKDSVQDSLDDFDFEIDDVAITETGGSDSEPDVGDDGAGWVDRLRELARKHMRPDEARQADTDDEAFYLPYQIVEA